MHTFVFKLKTRIAPLLLVFALAVVLHLVECVWWFLHLGISCCLARSEYEALDVCSENIKRKLTLYIIMMFIIIFFLERIMTFLFICCDSLL